MKELDKKINRNGFEYNQVYNGPEGYIYSQSYNGELIAYEAFKRTENELYDCVSFPGNESFGKWAWSCATLEAAQDRLGVTMMPID